MGSCMLQHALWERQNIMKTMSRRNLVVAVSTQHTSNEWSRIAHLRILSGSSGFHGCLIRRRAIQDEVLVGANPLQ